MCPRWLPRPPTLPMSRSLVRLSTRLSALSPWRSKAQSRSQSSRTVRRAFHGYAPLIRVCLLCRFCVGIHTGWDMDPFVIASFSKKIFRTRVIRHSLNPTWNEKMLFHLHRHEVGFNLNLTVLDWDKGSSNDNVGTVSFDLTELLANAPQANENTGLYENVEATVSHQELTLPIVAAKGIVFDKDTTPELSVK